MSLQTEYSGPAMESQIGVSEFLNHLYSGVSGRHYFELTLIKPGRGGAASRSYQLDFDRGRWDRPEWGKVMDLNAQGWGVYYGLTLKRAPVGRGRRSKEADASVCTVLWADIDLSDGVYASKREAYNAICALPFPATVIIDSGGGLHALWRIAPVPVTEDTLPRIKQTLRGLAVALKSDGAVAELARIFRLPGTINTKPERDGAPCQVIDWLPGQFQLDDFDDYRRMAEPDKPRLRRDVPRVRPDDLPAYVGWYLDTPQPPGQRNNTLNWTAYKMAADGYAQSEAVQILSPRALADGLDEDEIRRTIASAFRAPAGEPSYISPRNRVRMAAGDAVRRLIGGAS